MERNGVLEKEIHHRHPAQGPEREHQHTLLAHPRRSLCGVSEVTRGYRHVGPEAGNLERGERPVHLSVGEVDHEIDITSRPEVAVKDDRQPADDNISAPSLVQVAKQGFQGEHGENISALAASPAHPPHGMSAGGRDERHLTSVLPYHRWYIFCFP